MKFSLHIDTDKLPIGHEGRAISTILRDLADAFNGGAHFNTANHTYGSWGAATIYHYDKAVGSLELVKS